MSIADKIRNYKSEYDEMDPYRKNQLHIVIIGVVVLLAALYVLFGSFETLRSFFSR